MKKKKLLDLGYRYSAPHSTSSACTERGWDMTFQPSTPTAPTSLLTVKYINNKLRFFFFWRHFQHHIHMIVTTKQLQWPIIYQNNQWDSVMADLQRNLLITEPKGLIPRSTTAVWSVKTKNVDFFHNPRCYQMKLQRILGVSLFFSFFARFAGLKRFSVFLMQISKQQINRISSRKALLVQVTSSTVLQK